MRVLFIDDDEDIRKIARLSLEAVGRHEVVLAASAAEGITQARTCRPDVILIDMMMPGMDGLTALRELRALEETRFAPVVFVTAKVQKDELARYLEAGAAGVVQKPFDPLALPGEIQHILSRRL